VPKTYAPQGIGRSGVQGERKSARLRSRGCSATTLRPAAAEKKHRRLRRGSMSNDASSSSDETKTEDEAMAAGMMTLAIVCAHVQRKAAKLVLSAGNLASHKVHVLRTRSDLMFSALKSAYTQFPFMEVQHCGRKLQLL
jgi:hypothetical protein